MTRNAIVLLAAGLTGWLMTSAALAGAPVGPPTVTVSYADLDLNKAAGVEQLYARLRRAARSVCGGDADLRDLSAVASRDACVGAALSSAVAATHNARLSALAHIAPAGSGSPTS